MSQKCKKAYCKVQSISSMLKRRIVPKSHTLTLCGKFPETYLKSSPSLKPLEPTFFLKYNCIKIQSLSKQECRPAWTMVFNKFCSHEVCLKMKYLISCGVSLSKARASGFGGKCSDMKVTVCQGCDEDGNQTAQQS